MIIAYHFCKTMYLVLKKTKITNVRTKNCIGTFNKKTRNDLIPEHRPADCSKTFKRNSV